MENRAVIVRIPALWILGLVGLIALSACRSQPSMDALDEGGRRVLVVGSDLGNAPFAWIEGELDVDMPADWRAPREGEGMVLDAHQIEGTGIASGSAPDPLRALGRDVEMAEALAAHLESKLVWKRMPFDQLLDAAATGDVDVVIATLGWTAERAKRVALSDPYFRTSIRVVVRRGPGEPLTLGELAGKRISAGQGTTSELAVRRYLPDAQLALAGDKGQTGVAGLLSGDLDALVMDAPDAFDMVNADPERLLWLDDPLYLELYVIVVDPSQPALLEQVNAYLEQAESELAALNLRFHVFSNPITETVVQKLR